MKWILFATLAVVAFLVIQLIHLSVVLGWSDRKTVGVGYFGATAPERERFRAALARHARALRPILGLMSRFTSFEFARASFEHGGLPGPRGTCDAASFERAFAYRARPEDVFVATQMKSGTTWMQHVVYQILHRGDGNLVESGTALYAVSPWLESRKSVPVEKAPLLGSERPSRLIKTHLPASHCPYAAEARYIYVVRHPIACFASCADFIAHNAGPLSPNLAAIERWFVSDDMWWGPWPSHVAGWQRLSRERENVLFVSFEEMKTDLAGVARRVAGHLGVEPPRGDEMAKLVDTCAFDYMRRHAASFEMHPPHLLAVERAHFVRGSADRHRDVPPDTADRIWSWCRDRMAQAGSPLEDLYPT